MLDLDSSFLAPQSLDNADQEGAHCWANFVERSSKAIFTFCALELSEIDGHLGRCGICEVQILSADEDLIAKSIVGGNQEASLQHRPVLQQQAGIKGCPPRTVHLPRKELFLTENL